MNSKIEKKRSKFLSLILRHKPEVIGITLDKQGWADVEELLTKLNQKAHQLSKADLEYIVANNNKKRYTFNADKTKIRATQGHSIPIDLGYAPVEPPMLLYHGTATHFVESIKKTGLEKRSRQHVHLSADLATAKTVEVGTASLQFYTFKPRQCTKQAILFFFLKMAYG